MSLSGGTPVAIDLIYSRPRPKVRPGSLSAVRPQTIAGRHTEKDAPFISLRAHSIYPARQKAVERWVRVGTQEGEMLFRDRFHAGRLLADRLSQYANVPGVLVCALPRGGVLVGFPVAEALNAPLDVVIVRKLGVPGQQEVAMGAIATGGVCILSQELIEGLGISTQAVETVIAREQRELTRREALYRGAAPAPQIRGRTVILVDDGIATGATMRAAIAVVKEQQPKQLVIAVPVAPASMELAAEPDEIVCLAQPEPFYAIGQFYEDFHQVSDEEVRDLLQRAARRIARSGASTVA